MPLVEESIDVRMRSEELFPIVEDVEKFPDFMEGVKRVTVLERGEGYNVSEWFNEVDGHKIHWVERDVSKPDQNRIDFEQVSGDLKVMTGFWQLEEMGEVTKVTFSINFIFGIPFFAPLLHPLFARKLRENMRQMLEALRDAAESVPAGVK